MKSIHRHAIIIFNPVAGQGDPNDDLAKMHAWLDPYLSLTVEFTSPERTAEGLAKLACQQNSPDLIIAAGGDGTVSAVASALVKRDVPLGIIPRGTANALAKALEIPTDLEGACAAIAQGEFRTIDMARCNHSTMILLAGIGLEANTIRLADREAKKRLGPLAYIVAGLTQLKALEKFDAELEVEYNRRLTVSASAITIANAAPLTSILAHGPADIVPDDGLLDITIVASDSILEVIAASVNLFRSALQGQAATQESIGYFRAKHLKVTTIPPQDIIVDGESIGQTPLNIECVPQSLTVCVPSDNIVPLEHETSIVSLINPGAELS